MKSTKPPLVFLIHGFMGHPREFEPLVHFLESNGLDTHCVCLPQHGDFPGNLAETSWAAFLERCHQELLECQKHYEVIHLVGFSLGGALSLLLSRHCPEAFKTVTLISAPYKMVYNLDCGQYHLKNLFNRVLPGIQYWNERDTGHPKPLLYPFDIPKLYQEMITLFNEVQDAASMLQTPTLIIHSPFDLTVPYEHSEWLHETIPGETNFITLLKGGHQLLPFHVKGLVEESILKHIRLGTSAEYLPEVTGLEHPQPFIIESKPLTTASPS